MPLGHNPLRAQLRTVLAQRQVKPVWLAAALKCSVADVRNFAKGTKQLSAKKAIRLGNILKQLPASSGWVELDAGSVALQSWHDHNATVWKSSSRWPYLSYLLSLAIARPSQWPYWGERLEPEIESQEALNALVRLLDYKLKSLVMSKIVWHCATFHVPVPYLPDNKHFNFWYSTWMKHKEKFRQRKFSSPGV